MTNLQTQNQFFTAIVFSLSKEIKNLIHLIACSHYITKKPDINDKTLIERLELLHAKKLTIIQISDNEIPILEPRKISNSLETDLIIHHISARNFFQKEILEKLLVYNKENSKYFIYIFHNISYREIVDILRSFNIIVSGGSVTKRHIFSPLQLRLARFIIGINGLDDSEVIESFHNLDIEKFKINKDLTTKESKIYYSKIQSKREKLILEFKNKNKRLISENSELLKLKPVNTDPNLEFFTNPSLMANCAISPNKKI